MNHPEIIRLVIAYTLVGAFVFTAIITCLSLIGLVKFANSQQQNKLFYVMIVELVVGSVGFFFNFISFSPSTVSAKIESRAAQQADLSLTRQTAQAFTHLANASAKPQESKNSVVTSTQQSAVTDAPLRSTLPFLHVSTQEPHGGSLRILVDGEDVGIKTSGGSNVFLDNGTHVLNWLAMGPPAQPYSIDVTTPDAKSFQIRGKTGSNGKDAGARVFVYVK